MSRETFHAIKKGLEEALEFAKGNTTGARVHHVPRNVDITKLRSKLGLSQSEFAKGFGVPLGTVQNWEQGRRRPKGPAQVLLRIIQRDPEQALHAIWPELDRPQKRAAEEAR